MKNLNELINSEAFELFSKKVFNELLSDESLTITLAQEETLFSRLSNALVRQITNLNQAYIDFNFIKGNKTLTFGLPYRSTEEDFASAVKKIKQSREWIKHLPEDPYLVRPEFYGTVKIHGLNLV